MCLSREIFGKFAAFGEKLNTSFCVFTTFASLRSGQISVITSKRTFRPYSFICSKELKWSWILLLVSSCKE